VRVALVHHPPSRLTGPSQAAFEAWLTANQIHAVLTGHTHVPVAFIRDSHIRGGTYSKFKVEPGRKYFVNVGSVGQPRDNNPKAAYVIYDLDEGSIELRRLEYDIPKVQKKILQAGLPPRLAERLSDGK